MKIVNIELVRSDGARFLIDNTTWRIPSNGLEGFGTIDNDISTVDNALGDGEIIVSERLPSKDRTVMFVLAEASGNEMYRPIVQKFFNHKFTFKVYLTYMEQTRWCEGSLEKFAMSEGNVYKPMQVQFTVLCPNPYLKSVNNFGKDIAGVNPMWAFPWLCPSTGVPVSVYEFGKDVYLNNDGDVATYCRAEIVATGNVKNPKFFINGKYVRIIDNMIEGDSIVIDFEKQPPTITKNGKNIIGKCDRTSSFNGMQFNVGTNVIKYASDEGDSSMRCSVYFYKQHTSM